MSSTEHHKICCKRTRNFTFLFIEKIYSSNFTVQRYQSCLKGQYKLNMDKFYFWSGMDFVQMHLTLNVRDDEWIGFIVTGDDRSLFLIVTFLRPMTNLLNSMHCQSIAQVHFPYFLLPLSLTDWQELLVALWHCNWQWLSLSSCVCSEIFCIFLKRRGCFWICVSPFTIK